MDDLLREYLLSLKTLDQLLQAKADIEANGGVLRLEDKDGRTWEYEGVRMEVQPLTPVHSDEITIEPVHLVETPYTPPGWPKNTQEASGQSKDIFVEETFTSTDGTVLVAILCADDLLHVYRLIGDEITRPICGKETAPVRGVTHKESETQDLRGCASCCTLVHEIANRALN